MSDSNADCFQHHNKAWFFGIIFISGSVNWLQDQNLSISLPKNFLSVRHCLCCPAVCDYNMPGFLLACPRVRFLVLVARNFSQIQCCSILSLSSCFGTMILFQFRRQVCFFPKDIFLIWPGISTGYLLTRLLFLIPPWVSARNGCTGSDFGFR